MRVNYFYVACFVAGCLDAQPARYSALDDQSEGSEAISNRDPGECLCPPGTRCEGRECVYDERSAEGETWAEGEDPGDLYDCTTSGECPEGFHCHESGECYFDGECVRDEQCRGGTFCLGFFCQCPEGFECENEQIPPDDEGDEYPGDEDPESSEGEGELPLPTEGEGEGEHPFATEGEGEVEPHCEPFVEVCNNVDDDCDGLTDEEMPMLECGLGICARTFESCSGGMPQQCVPGDPEDELCNGRDDDCDGLTDEEMPMLECGLGICARTFESCSGGMPQQCVPGDPEDELCNGRDDDCDGLTDEELGSISCGVGPCAVSIPACVDGVSQQCEPGIGGVESCNGIDDDCDGLTDEGDPEGGSDCDTGAHGMCALGSTRCSNGELVCDDIKHPSDELCNGLDDDCDGLTDEDMPMLECGLGICARSVGACVDGVESECVPGDPEDELCNGLDDDCDGSVDENVPEFGDDCDTGQIGACQRGFLACHEARLHCIQYSQPRPERCNGRDDDCDGLTDEELRDLTCGVGECYRTVSACIDGQAQECIPGEPREESCIPGETVRTDDDCDGDSDNAEGCLRLVGGDAPTSGRLEIYHANEWGTICDDAWTARDDPFENADVACIQLGFQRALDAQGQGESPFGHGRGPIWMDNVQCTGDEERLVDCEFPEEDRQDFGVHNCNHNEDVAIFCE